MFYIGDYELELPVGTYETVDIQKVINQLLKKRLKTLRNKEFLNRSLFKPAIVRNIKITKPLGMTTDKVIKKKQEKPILPLKSILKNMQI